ncbi:Josephin-domain-containing protein [Cubamyces menziesii]|nr:Josephin-domain-containing protein [Cubamyces menziesii]
MSAIDNIIPLIYHERQQEGSMLCAQHALNSLLQGPYFSPAELSEIAHRLDEAEHGFLENSAGAASTNMDDTGFFSVQVLEEALKVWNLTLVRWRSEAMRAYQDHPHTQMGFILNQSQHWYTLRRFGLVSPDPSLDADPGNGHWFNLNSFLAAPERIGKLYLGMFLQQAEAEGYSVFAVLQRDPEGALAIPRTEADEIAASIPESAATHYSSSRQASTSNHPLTGVEGFDDEDMELQAALQASLAGGAFDPSTLPVFSSAGAGDSRNYQSSTSYQAPSRTYASAAGRDYEMIDDNDDDDDEVEIVERARAAAAPAEPEDAVAASMARQRAMMERMRRHQEAALREQYEDEVAQFGAAAARRRQQDEDEDEMLRRAIAESEAMAQAEAARQPSSEQPGEESASAAPPARAWQQHRVYDDEDEELQAALRASLETVPEGFRVPSPPPVVPPQPPRQASGSSTPQPPPIQRQPSSDVETESEAEAPEPEEQLSMEEIRRRRLARFGG